MNTVILKVMQLRGQKKGVIVIKRVCFALSSCRTFVSQRVEPESSIKPAAVLLPMKSLLLGSGPPPLLHKYTTHICCRGALIM